MAEPDNSFDTAIAPSTFEPLTEAGPGPGPQRPGKRRHWMAIATAVVFIAIMGFLLTARSLQITVIADSEAEISIAGGLYLPFGERYLLPRGDYQVSVSAEGYHPLSSDITVTDEDSQALELILRPLPGRLTFLSQPTGAKVYIDDELLGTTPLQDILVEAGEHRLVLEAQRFLHACWVRRRSRGLYRARSSRRDDSQNLAAYEELAELLVLRA